MTATTIAGRAALVGLIAVAAIGTAWWMVPDAFPALSARPRFPDAATNVTPGAASRAALAASATPGPAAPAPGANAAPTASAAVAPRLDVARVGARGMLVAAGHAGPGAEVVLYDGGRELGRARADARGEWVILPTEPLRPGARELLLAARSPGADTVAALETLVLQVPETAGPAQVAARSATADGRDATPTPAESAAGQDVGAAPRTMQGAVGPADATRQRLGLDAVDYDDGGAMRFAGRAPPGTTVRIYVGRNHFGDAVADAGGRWQLTPVQQPIIGRHTLRVDQVAASGTVAARIEVPFQRDPLPATAFAADQLVVQPGQSLWRIARRVYGRGGQYTVIYQANREQIRDPERIYPGQVFALPGETVATDRPGPAQAVAGEAPQAVSSRPR